MKLQLFTDWHKGTPHQGSSKGVYRIKGLPLLVMQANIHSGDTVWRIYISSDVSYGPQREIINKWITDNDFGIYNDFPTRTQALDAVQMTIDGKGLWQ